MKKKSKNFFLKLTALTLILCLVFQEFSYALPEGLSALGGRFKIENGNKNNLAWAKKLLPAIPESIASIEDAWKSPRLRELTGDAEEGSRRPGASPKDGARMRWDTAAAGPVNFPVVILIQDPHTNFSGQRNIAKTLESLIQQHPIDKIFVEAGFGDVSLTALKSASLEKRKQVGTKYLRSGELSGPEYLNLTSQKDFTLYGVEDKTLYWQSLEVYRAIVSKRQKFQDYLDKVENTIHTLKSKTFNPFLRTFDQHHQDFLQEKLPAVDYLLTLLNHSQALSLNLSNYPQLKTLQKLQKIEDRIDFKHPGQDKLKLIYLKKSKTFNTPKLLEEQHKLEKDLYQALIQTQDEEKLHKATIALRNLKALLNLTLTPDEFRAYEENPKDFDITKLTGFLNQRIMQLEEYYDKAIFLEEGFEDTLKKCTQFYELTRKRDEQFISNMLDGIKNVKHPAGPTEHSYVLVAGGYHSPNLKSLLKSKNISYITLTPQISNETDHKRYEELLLSQKPTSTSGPADKIALLAMINRAAGRLATMPQLAKELEIPAARSAGGETASPMGGRLAKEGPVETVDQKAVVEKVSSRVWRVLLDGKSLLRYKVQGSLIYVRMSWMSEDYLFKNPSSAAEFMTGTLQGSAADESKLLLKVRQDEENFLIKVFRGKLLSEDQSSHSAISVPWKNPEAVVVAVADSLNQALNPESLPTAERQPGQKIDDHIGRNALDGSRQMASLMLYMNDPTHPELVADEDTQTLLSMTSTVIGKHRRNLSKKGLVRIGTKPVTETLPNGSNRVSTYASMTLTDSGRQAVEQYGTDLEAFAKFIKKYRKPQAALSARDKTDSSVGGRLANGSLDREASEVLYLNKYPIAQLAEHLSSDVFEKPVVAFAPPAIAATLQPLGFSQPVSENEIVDKTAEAIKQSNIQNFSLEPIHNTLSVQFKYPVLFAGHAIHHVVYAIPDKKDVEDLLNLKIRYNRMSQTILSQIAMDFIQIYETKKIIPWRLYVHPSADALSHDNTLDTLSRVRVIHLLKQRGIQAMTMSLLDYRQSDLRRLQAHDWPGVSLEKVKQSVMAWGWLRINHQFYSPRSISKGDQIAKFLTLTTGFATILALLGPLVFLLATTGAFIIKMIHFAFPPQPHFFGLEGPAVNDTKFEKVRKLFLTVESNAAERSAALTAWTDYLLRTASEDESIFNRTFAVNILGRLVEALDESTPEKQAWKSLITNYQNSEFSSGVPRIDNTWALPAGSIDAGKTVEAWLESRGISKDLWNTSSAASRLAQEMPIEFDSYPQMVEWLRKELKIGESGEMQTVVIGGQSTAGKGYLGAELARQGHTALFNTDGFTTASHRNLFKIAWVFFILSFFSIKRAENFYLGEFWNRKDLDDFVDQIHRARRLVGQDGLHEFMIEPRFQFSHRPPEQAEAMKRKARQMVQKGTTILVEGSYAKQFLQGKVPIAKSVLLTVDSGIARDRYRRRQQNREEKRHWLWALIRKFNFVFKWEEAYFKRHRKEYDYVIDLSNFNKPRVHLQVPIHRPQSVGDSSDSAARLANKPNVSPKDHFGPGPVEVDGPVDQAALSARDKTASPVGGRLAAAIEIDDPINHLETADTFLEIVRQEIATTFPEDVEARKVNFAIKHLRSNANKLVNFWRRSLEDDGDPLIHFEPIKQQIGRLQDQSQQVFSNLADYLKPRSHDRSLDRFRRLVFQENDSGTQGYLFQAIEQINLFAAAYPLHELKTLAVNTDQDALEVKRGLKSAKGKVEVSRALDRVMTWAVDIIEFVNEYEPGYFTGKIQNLHRRSAEIEQTLADARRAASPRIFHWSAAEDLWSSLDDIEVDLQYASRILDHLDQEATAARLSSQVDNALVMSVVDAGGETLRSITLPPGQKPSANLLTSLEYFPVVFLVVSRKVNGRLQFLLQKRSADKEFFPGAWETTVSGKQNVGESSSEAVLREASEELMGKFPSNHSQIVQIDRKPFIFTEKGVPARLLHTVYASMVSENNPAFDRVDEWPATREVSEWRWMELEEIQQLAQQSPEALTVGLKAIVDDPKLIDRIRQLDVTAARLAVVGYQLEAVGPKENKKLIQMKKFAHRLWKQAQTDDEAKTIFGKIFSGLVYPRNGVQGILTVSNKENGEPIALRTIYKAHHLQLWSFPDMKTEPKISYQDKLSFEKRLLVGDIAVDSRHRGKGIAKWLYAEGFRYAMDLPDKDYHLVHVYRDNTDSLFAMLSSAKTLGLPVYGPLPQQGDYYFGYLVDLHPDRPKSMGDKAILQRFGIFNSISTSTSTGAEVAGSLVVSKSSSGPVSAARLAELSDSASRDSKKPYLFYPYDKLSDLKGNILSKIYLDGKTHQTMFDTARRSESWPSPSWMKATVLATEEFLKISRGRSSIFTTLDFLYQAVRESILVSELRPNWPLCCEAASWAAGFAMEMMDTGSGNRFYRPKVYQWRDVDPDETSNPPLLEEDFHHHFNLIEFDGRKWVLDLVIAQFPEFKYRETHVAYDEIMERSNQIQQDLGLNLAARLAGHNQMDFQMRENESKYISVADWTESSRLLVLKFTWDVNKQAPVLQRLETAFEGEGKPHAVEESGDPYRYRKDGYELTYTYSKEDQKISLKTSDDFYFFDITEEMLAVKGMSRGRPVRTVKASGRTGVYMVESENKNDPSIVLKRASKIAANFLRARYGDRRSPGEFVRQVNEGSLFPIMTPSEDIESPKLPNAWFFSQEKGTNLDTLFNNADPRIQKNILSVFIKNIQILAKRGIFLVDPKIENFTLINVSKDSKNYSVSTLHDTERALSFTKDGRWGYGSGEERVAGGQNVFGAWNVLSFLYFLNRLLIKDKLSPELREAFIRELELSGFVTVAALLRHEKSSEILKVLNEWDSERKKSASNDQSESDWQVYLDRVFSPFGFTDLRQDIQNDFVRLYSHPESTADQYPVLDISTQYLKDPSFRDVLKTVSVLIVSIALFMGPLAGTPFIFFRSASALTGNIASSFIQKEDVWWKYPVRWILSSMAVFVMTPFVIWYIILFKGLTDYPVAFRAAGDVMLLSIPANLPAIFSLVAKDVKTREPLKEYGAEYWKTFIQRVKLYFRPHGLYVIITAFWIPIANFNYGSAMSMGSIEEICVIFGLVFSLLFAFYSALPSQDAHIPRVKKIILWSFYFLWPILFIGGSLGWTQDPYLRENFYNIIGSSLLSTGAAMLLTMGLKPWTMEKKIEKEMTTAARLASSSTTKEEPIVQFGILGSKVQAVAISRDGQYVAAVTEDSKLRVWDLNSLDPKVIWSASFEGIPRTVEWSGDRHLLAVGTEEGTIYVYNADSMESNKLLATIPAHQGIVRSISFSEDKLQIVSVADDNKIKFYDPNTGRSFPSMNWLKKDKKMSAVALSPDGHYMALGFDSGYVGIWNVVTGQETKLKGLFSDHIHTLFFEKNGLELVAASWNGTIRRWDTVGGRQIDSVLGTPRSASSRRLSQDGQRIVVGRQDGMIQIWPTIQRVNVGDELLRKAMPAMHVLGTLISNPDTGNLLTALNELGPEWKWITDDDKEGWNYRRHEKYGLQIEVNSRSGAWRLWSDSTQNFPQGHLVMAWGPGTGFHAATSTVGSLQYLSKQNPLATFHDTGEKLHLQLNSSVVSTFLTRSWFLEPGEQTNLSRSWSADTQLVGARLSQQPFQSVFAGSILQGPGYDKEAPHKVRLSIFYHTIPSQKIRTVLQERVKPTGDLREGEYGLYWVTAEQIMQAFSTTRKGDGAFLRLRVPIGIDWRKKTKIPTYFYGYKKVILDDRLRTLATKQLIPNLDTRLPLLNESEKRARVSVGSYALIQNQELEGAPFLLALDMGSVIGSLRGRRKPDYRLKFLGGGAWLTPQAKGLLSQTFDVSSKPKANMPFFARHGKLDFRINFFPESKLNQLLDWIQKQWQSGGIETDAFRELKEELGVRVGQNGRLRYEHGLFDLKETHSYFGVNGARLATGVAQPILDSAIQEDVQFLLGEILKKPGRYKNDLTMSAGVIELGMENARRILGSSRPTSRVFRDRSDDGVVDRFNAELARQVKLEENFIKFNLLGVDTVIVKKLDPRLDKMIKTDKIAWLVFLGVAEQAKHLESGQTVFETPVAYLTLAEVEKMVDRKTPFRFKREDLKLNDMNRVLEEFFRGNSLVFQSDESRAVLQQWVMDLKKVGITGIRVNANKSLRPNASQIKGARLANSPQNQTSRYTVKLLEAASQGGLLLHRPEDGYLDPLFLEFPKDADGNFISRPDRKAVKRWTDDADILSQKLIGLGGMLTHREDIGLVRNIPSPHQDLISALAEHLQVPYQPKRSRKAEDRSLILAAEGISRVFYAEINHRLRVITGLAEALHEAAIQGDEMTSQWGIHILHQGQILGHVYFQAFLQWMINDLGWLSFHGELWDIRYTQERQKLFLYTAPLVRYFYDLYEQFVREYKNPLDYLTYTQSKIAFIAENLRDELLDLSIYADKNIPPLHEYLSIFNQNPYRRIRERWQVLKKIAPALLLASLSKENQDRFVELGNYFEDHLQYTGHEELSKTLESLQWKEVSNDLRQQARSLQTLYPSDQRVRRQWIGIEEHLNLERVQQELDAIDGAINELQNQVGLTSAARLARSEEFDQLLTRLLGQDYRRKVSNTQRRNLLQLDRSKASFENDAIKILKIRQISKEATKSILSFLRGESGLQKEPSLIQEDSLINSLAKQLGIEIYVPRSARTEMRTNALWQYTLDVDDNTRRIIHENLIPAYRGGRPVPVKITFRGNNAVYITSEGLGWKDLPFDDREQYQENFYQFVYEAAILENRSEGEARDHAQKEVKKIKNFDFVIGHSLEAGQTERSIESIKDWIFEHTRSGDENTQFIFRGTLSPEFKGEQISSRTIQRKSARFQKGPESFRIITRKIPRRTLVRKAGPGKTYSIVEEKLAPGKNGFVARVDIYLDKKEDSDIKIGRFYANVDVDAESVMSDVGYVVDPKWQNLGLMSEVLAQDASQFFRPGMVFEGDVINKGTLEYLAQVLSQANISGKEAELNQLRQLLAKNPSEDILKDMIITFMEQGYVFTPEDIAKTPIGILAIRAGLIDLKFEVGSMTVEGFSKPAQAIFFRAKVPAARLANYKKLKRAREKNRKMDKAFDALDLAIEYSRQVLNREVPTDEKSLQGFASDLSNAIAKSHQVPGKYLTDAGIERRRSILANLHAKLGSVLFKIGRYQHEAGSFEAAEESYSQSVHHFNQSIDLRKRADSLDVPKTRYYLSLSVAARAINFYEKALSLNIDLKQTKLKWTKQFYEGYLTTSTVDHTTDEEVDLAIREGEADVALLRQLITNAKAHQKKGARLALKNTAVELTGKKVVWPSALRTLSDIDKVSFKMKLRNPRGLHELVELISIPENYALIVRVNGVETGHVGLTQRNGLLEISLFNPFNDKKLSDYQGRHLARVIDAGIAHLAKHLGAPLFNEGTASPALIAAHLENFASQASIGENQNWTPVKTIADIYKMEHVSVAWTRAGRPSSKFSAGLRFSKGQDYLVEDLHRNGILSRKGFYDQASLSKKGAADVSISGDGYVQAKRNSQLERMLGRHLYRIYEIRPFVRLWGEAKPAVDLLGVELIQEDGARLATAQQPAELTDEEYVAGVVQIMRDKNIEYYEQAAWFVYRLLQAAKIWPESGPQDPRDISDEEKGYLLGESSPLKRADRIISILPILGREVFKFLESIPTSQHEKFAGWVYYVASIHTRDNSKRFDAVSITDIFLSQIPTKFRMAGRLDEINREVNHLNQFGNLHQIEVISAHRDVVLGGRVFERAKKYPSDYSLIVHHLQMSLREYMTAKDDSAIAMQGTLMAQFNLFLSLFSRQKYVYPYDGFVDIFDKLGVSDSQMDAFFLSFLDSKEKLIDVFNIREFHKDTLNILFRMNYDALLDRFPLTVSRLGLAPTYPLFPPHPSLSDKAVQGARLAEGWSRLAENTRDEASLASPGVPKTGVFSLAEENPAQSSRASAKPLRGDLSEDVSKDRLPRSLAPASPAGRLPRNDNKSSVARFVLNVANSKHLSQGFEGSIAIGDDTLLKVQVESGKLIVHGLGSRPVVIRKHFRLVKGKGKVSKAVVDMSVFQRIFRESDAAMDTVLEGVPEAISQTKAILAIDLDWFGREELGPNLSYLIPRLIADSKRDQNFRVLLRGDSWKIDQALAQANTSLGKNQKLFYRDKEALVNENSGYDTAPSASLDSWDGKTATPSFPGARRLLVRRLERGDVPNLNVLRVSLLEARIGEMKTSNPQFTRFRRTIEILLGRSITNDQDFIDFVEGRSSNNLGFYALKPLLHTDQLLQVLRLAQRMAEQSA